MYNEANVVAVDVGRNLFSTLDCEDKRTILLSLGQIDENENLTAEQLDAKFAAFGYDAERVDQLYTKYRSIKNYGEYFTEEA